MLVDDRPDLQVLMLERHADVVFGGGMWVFPGGRVDDTDDPQDFQRFAIHRDDAEASALMNLPRGGLSYYIAAIREAFEEAGILLAVDQQTGATVDLSDGRFDQHRDDVNDSNRAFIEIMEEENLLLDVGQMHYIARWITPEGPPRRYDTRFFITRIPDNQVPRQDDGELVRARWLRPDDILRMSDTEEIVMMTPTIRMVRQLAKFSSTDDVIASAEQNLPDERARVNENREILLPGEPGYPQADETIENGWVRLRP